MKSHFAPTLMLLLASGLVVDVPLLKPGSVQAQTTRRNRGTADKTPAVKLPDDPRLLELHRALVRDAEKIAVEYQKSKQLDKARVVYGEIIRFVPSYGKAANQLQTIRGAEATAERKVFEVAATKGWQNTGIEIAEGRPILFRVFDGKWRLLMEFSVGPEGIEIPKELRQFSLGSLIGIIVPPGTTPEEATRASISSMSEDSGAAEGGAAPQAEGQPASADSSADSSSSSASNEEKKEEYRGPKPFFVGSKLDLIAPNSGHLYLRMYDNKSEDNRGNLKVTITGTFGPPPTYAGSKESTLGKKDE